MSNYTYMVTNTINGKVYVGSHSWSGEGIDKNYYGSGTAITRAVKKYGKENFQVEVLYYYDTVEECRKDEERILTEYNVRDCPHSYNIKNGAIGWTSEDKKGYKHHYYGKHLSEEHRKKLSQAFKGEKHHMYGKHHTEETKQKLSEAHKGKTLSDEHRKKISEAVKGEKHPLYGKHPTEETRKKISQANKGRAVSEKQKEALLQANNYRKTPLVAIQIDTGKVKIFESQHECGRVLGIDQRRVNDCLKGRLKTHKGYCFKYVEELESGIYEGITGMTK